VPKLSHRQWLFIIFVVALLLRVVALGSKSLWLDEAFGAYHAQRPELAAPVYIEGTHPPLYYTILHYWVLIAGSGEVALRLPSVIMSLGGIGLLYLLARLLYGREVGLLAAALLAVTPLDVWYAQEARMYIFITFFGLLLALALLWNKPTSIALVAIAVGVGLWVDYLMLPVWAAISAGWLVYLSRSRRSPVPYITWLAGSTVGWWLYRDWLPYLRASLNQAFGSVFIFAQLRAMLGLPELTTLHFIGALALATAAVAVGVTLLARLVQTDKGHRLATVGTLLVVVAVSGLTVTPRLYSVKRVLVTGWPYVLLLMAWLIVRGSASHRRLAAAVIAVSLVTTLGTLTQQKDDWRAATEYVESESTEKALIWLDPDWNHFPYNYYAERTAPVSGTVEELAAAASESDEIWLIAERFPSLPTPSSLAEAWLDENWKLVQQQPFYRLEVRGYRPR
jgi:mannosyltransferase